MRKMVVLTAVSAMVVALAAGHCLAADEKAAAKEVARPAAKAAPNQGPPVAVLDTYSVWRVHQTFRPPVIRFDDGPKPVLTPNDWLDRETPEPPADWTAPEFDDTVWVRGSAKAYARTPYLSRLCLRARFEVTDPSAVGGLKLSLTYYGGAVVYVNGREVARGNLAAGVPGPAALAEDYPPEAFVGDDGKILSGAPWIVDRIAKVVAARTRKLSDVPIPPSVLRKGVNVVAIELVRAPYHKIVDEKKGQGVDKKTIAARGSPYDLTVNTCELRSLQLTASGGDALVPNAARPKTLQVWNGDFLTPDYESDRADRCEPVRPVTIQGVRNGWFSGKVVLGSAKGIEGLAATCSDLTQGGVKIPASAVRVRYGYSWGGYVSGYGDATLYGAPLLDGLLDAPLDVFAGGKYGTVVPIWVTVKVPADAKPGTYTGQLAITAKGEPPRAVPVSLAVADWTLPDVQDWRTWVELVQSPDTLAAEYGVPSWSDRHWEMIDQSLRHIGQIGSRVVYVPLISHTNYGNEQSMVRWIKADDGTYSYDFSVMDKYLDLAAKNIGKPKFVVFTAWEVYLAGGGKEPPAVTEEDKKDPWLFAHKEAAVAKWNLRNKGPAVTVLDSASGKVDTVYLPRFEKPGAKALWQPLFAELRRRMQKRGWEDTMMLGMASDTWPSKEELAVLQEASGGLPWIMHTHGGSRVGRKMHNLAPIGYIAYVWNTKYGPNPSEGHVYGWKQPELMVEFRRFTALNQMPAAGLLHFEEINITGHQRGVGRIGADMWPVYKNSRGQRNGWVADRYPQSFWHSLNLGSHMLVPGPNGPVASTRYEVFREGIQQCEARIAIERALTDETLKAKLGPELAGRCQTVLDDRLREAWRAGSSLQLTGRNYASGKVVGDYYGCPAGHYWFLGSQWQERTQEFYQLAGEVARKLDRP